MDLLKLSRYQIGILGLWTNHTEIHDSIDSEDFCKLFELDQSGSFPAVPEHSSMTHAIYMEASEVFSSSFDDQ